MKNQDSGFLSKMSIKQKIILLAVSIALLVMSTALFFTVKNIKESLLSANQDKIEQITELVYNIVDSYKKEADAKIIPLATAQKIAIKKIASIKYDGSNYVWINDYSGNMIYHPTLKGNASDLADKNGVRFIAEGTALAKDKGSGVVKYLWKKQGQDPSKTYPKISFFRSYPEWRWVIGTGIYVDDVSWIEAACSVLPSANFWLAASN